MGIQLTGATAAVKQFDDLITRARSAPLHIVLAEGLDERIVDGAVQALQGGIARITLLGPVEDVRKLTRAAGDIEDEVTVIDPEHSPNNDAYAAAYHTLRQHKGVSLEDAKTAIKNPLNFADMMVHLGDAHGSVAGAAHTTGDVVRSALQIIGVDPNYSMVSSFFLMLMYEDFHPIQGGVVFADCALIVQPDENQLAEIASAAADSGQSLLKLTPKIAMLSFSTRHSADHPDVDKIENAAALLKERRPELAVEGGIQFDAAINQDVARKKAFGSDVAGQANIFVFPDLNSGNIGYKIAERIGGAKAIGPILQGLLKPANDLSRGCNSEDVYRMVAVTVVQAQALAGHS